MLTYLNKHITTSKGFYHVISYVYWFVIFIICHLFTEQVNNYDARRLIE